jgi:hypothetical protein
MIDKVLKGQGPTLLHTDKANELIDAANAFVGMRVSPANAGSLTINDGFAVLKLVTPAGAIDLGDLTVYDTDGTSVLHTGGVALLLRVDDSSPPATLPLAWYKVAACDGETAGTRFILSTEFEPDA